MESSDSTAVEKPPGAVQGQGFSVVDGIALVLGAAVAAVHMRELVSIRDLTLFGWALVWITFGGIALTAAGPFLLLERRYFRRLRPYPRMGDKLWAALGTPWVLSTLLSPSSRGSGTVAPPQAFVLLEGTVSGYGVLLWGGLVLACLIVLGVLWKNWILVSPEQARTAEPLLWTEWTGMILAVAWPLQCGFGLVVMG